MEILKSSFSYLPLTEYGARPQCFRGTEMEEEVELEALQEAQFTNSLESRPY